MDAKQLNCLSALDAQCCLQRQTGVGGTCSNGMSVVACHCNDVDDCDWCLTHFALVVFFDWTEASTVAGKPAKESIDCSIDFERSKKVRRERKTNRWRRFA